MNAATYTRKNQLLEHLYTFADSIWVGQGRDNLPDTRVSASSGYTVTMTMGPAFETACRCSNPKEIWWCVHYYLQQADMVSGRPLYQETGYWLFDFPNRAFCKTVSTPQGVGILAGGAFTVNDVSGLVMVASANADDPEYGITNEPCANRGASTRSFTTTMTQTQSTFSYSETSVLLMSGVEVTRQNDATLTLQQ